MPCICDVRKVYALNVVGVIPDELWTLTFLTNLTVGINALSGELPKELGNMTDMRSFAIGSNNFSGPLPSELGNWTKLEQFYIDSSGVSGEIPSTLAKLPNMATVWASDTELTGRIPDFIGNWSKLTSLRFQGNSFDGPIPSSFSNLNLTDLRISGLSNGSSTLAFMKNMKSLSFLEIVFRSCLLQGNCVQKDFDIKNEVGGVSKRAVQRLFTARVSENYLEIHLYWAGKGTCCVLVQGTYGPSISGISAIPMLLGIDAKPYTFSYSEMKTATEDFSLANKLGEGGRIWNSL
ncbi:hypothetical protein LWI29_019992 [Acer saccharum]|uniref:non-specific serine/threonine protein kinase n=1 Tax=Acer saccharum TaxID=4024 RepID=A0AA39SP77_ACESA|nr:hypothetical protein LWI29_019992 [Acer saccharum]